MRSPAAILALVSLLSTAAHAAPHRRELSAAEQRYRKLVADALHEYDLAHYEEALALFQQAYAASPTARVLRGIGKVQFELRQYTRSVEAFDQALACTTDPLTGTLKTEVEELRTRSLRYIATLAITVTPPGAEVTVDGRVVEPAARGALRVDAGAHTVEATLAGYLPAHRTIDAAGGQEQALALTLVPVPVAGAPDKPKRGLFYTGLALDGAFVAGLGGTVGWFVDRDRALSRCAAATATGATCVNARDIATQRDAAIGMVTISAIGLVAAGVVTYFGWRRAHQRPREVAAVCAPDATGASCSIVGRF